MSTTVMLVVLLAALLHASWNFLVKKADDKLLSMSAVVIGHVPLALVMIPFAEMPDSAAWPYLLATMVLHTGYQWFLLNSYKVGDLSQVYPLARGVAPLLVTLISLFILGVALSTWELLAVVLIGCGIISLALLKQSSGVFNHKAALLALTTGGFIAGYSLVDGLGARVAGDALGYYIVGTAMNSIVWAVYIRIKRPGLIQQLFTTEWKLTLGGGGASFAAYALVVWAFMSAPIALVTALRETSIVFAMLLGVLVLGERLSWQKILAVLLTIGGVLLLRFSQT